MRVKFDVLEQIQGIDLHAIFYLNVFIEKGEGGEVERVHAKFHLTVFTVSTSCGQKLQFWANFDIWCIRADPRYTLARHISSECVQCWFPYSTKPQVWTNLTFGDFYTDPLLPMRAKFSALEQTHGIRLLTKFRLDRFILSLAAKNPNFVPFSGLRHLVVSPVGSSLRKLNTVHNYTNLPLSKGIKTVSVFQRLHGEIWRTNSYIQKRDGLTDKAPAFLPPLRQGNPNPTKLGMAVEFLEDDHAPGRLLGVQCKVSPLGGAENLGETRHPLLKTLIIP